MLIILPKAKKLKLTPNLTNYPRTYARFDLKKASRVVEYHPDGKHLNAAYNAVTRHSLNQNKNKLALIHLDSDLGETKYTFSELEALSNRFAHLIREQGNIKKGDRVFFFLPRVPTLYYGFLGTLKIGAIAGTLFSAFGEQALLDRLHSSGAKMLVTTPELLPRLKNIRRKLPNLKHVITTTEIATKLHKYPDTLKLTPTKPTDPAFMLYTSGTTGKPKGVVHAHKAIIQEHLTAQWVLDLKETDIYWCTADPGWVTGIAYQILANLSTATTTIVFEGRFDPNTWYKIIEKYKVTVWYTAPTAIRLLQASGKKLTSFYNLSSLRHMCSVGEPLNPGPLLWGKKTFGMPFHDTWWQTETGAICIANYPSLPLKPGSMGKPVPGVEAAILDEKGKPLPPLTEGNLALKKGWVSMMEKIWNRPKKYNSYFINGWYISGDRGYIDRDGYFFFIGRSDDVIKTSGERVGPFEVESALVAHPAVIEAGVIGKPDALRGQIIKAFVALTPGYKPSKKLKQEIQTFVKHHLAGHAYPREIEFIKHLPKTRSGKIVRRLLRAKELGLPLGDTSTLAEY